MFGMNDPSKPVTLESLMAMLQQGQPSAGATPGTQSHGLLGMMGNPQPSGQTLTGLFRGAPTQTGTMPGPDATPPARQTLSGIMGIGGGGGSSKGGAVKP